MLEMDMSMGDAWERGEGTVIDCDTMVYGVEVMVRKEFAVDRAS